MEQYDLVVVGAGPAGLTLAASLVDSGLKILLLDKKKNAGDVHYNTLGSFIDPLEWSLPEDILHPFHEVYFTSKNESFTKKINANAINRRKLLVVLEERSKKNKNLEIEYSAVIGKIKRDGRGVRSIVYSKDGKEREVSGRIFADCSGLGVVLAREIGLAPSNPVMAVGAEYVVPLKSPSNTLELFVGSDFKGGYGWSYPQDSETAVLGYGTLHRENFPHVEEYLKRMWNSKRISERYELKPIERNIAVLRTGMPLTRFTENNVIMVGDSALQVNPLIGEGVRFVMDSSRMASEWITESLKNDDLSLLKNYEREWIKKYYKKYRIAYRLQREVAKMSLKDAWLDFGVKRARNLSSENLTKILMGDLSYSFLIKVALCSI